MRTSPLSRGFSFYNKNVSFMEGNIYFCEGVFDNISKLAIAFPFRL
jgi:hypothetical protein